MTRLTHRRLLGPLGSLAVLLAGACERTVAGPEDPGANAVAVAPLASLTALGFTTYTDRAAWAAAAAAAGATVQNLDFTALTLGRVTQLDTDYGPFRIVIDQLSATTFSNPGLSIFPDASCSLGSGDCMVFTFNVQDPTSTFDAPRINEVVFPSPIVAFGGDFIQVGMTAPPPGSVTGPVTLHFGANTVVLNNFLDAGGNGFFGFVASAPATTVGFTYAKAASLQNDIFQVYNPAIATGSGSTPADQIADLAVALAGLGLPDGTGTSLDAKLRAALDAIGAGDTALACTKLQDFINAVAAQSGKRISPANVESLIAAATGIRTALGC